MLLRVILTTVSFIAMIFCIVSAITSNGSIGWTINVAIYSLATGIGFCCIVDKLH